MFYIRIPSITNIAKDHLENHQKSYFNILSCVTSYVHIQLQIDLHLYMKHLITEINWLWDLKNIVGNSVDNFTKTFKIFMLFKVTVANI